MATTKGSAIAKAKTDATVVAVAAGKKRKTQPSCKPIQNPTLPKVDPVIRKPRVLKFLEQKQTFCGTARWSNGSIGEVAAYLLTMHVEERGVWLAMLAMFRTQPAQMVVRQLHCDIVKERAQMRRLMRNKPKVYAFSKKTMIIQANGIVRA